MKGERINHISYIHTFIFISSSFLPICNNIAQFISLSF